MANIKKQLFPAGSGTINAMWELAQCMPLNEWLNCTVGTWLLAKALVFLLDERVQYLILLSEFKINIDLIVWLV